MQEGTPREWSWWTMTLALSLIIVTMVHTAQDIVFGEPVQFHLSPRLYGGLVGGIYAVMAAALAVPPRLRHGARYVLMAVGLFWAAGAAIVHLPAIWSRPVWRTGWWSVFWVYAIIVNGCGLAYSAWRDRVGVDAPVRR